MEGFLSNIELKDKTGAFSKGSCTSCGLYKNCNSPMMKTEGKFSKKIINIFSSPTKNEDLQSRPFKNRLAEKLLKELRIDIQMDCLNVYAIRCFTKEPQKFYANCRKELFKIIQEYKPEKIILWGEIPVLSVIKNRWTKDIGTIEKWRGFCIPDQDLQTYLCPVYGEEVEDNQNPMYLFYLKKDLKNIMNLPKFPVYVEPTVKVLKELSVLNTLENCTIAFDYETTGIKPQAEGHKIMCVSIAVNALLVYVFRWDKIEDKEPFFNLLKRKSVSKVAHNMKYENNWTKVLLKLRIRNWGWDTMLGTHYLDNRPGICSLKFQTYVQLGIIDYTSDVDITSTNSNAFNNLPEKMSTLEGEKQIMKYCALDSIHTFRLYLIHMKKMMEEKNSFNLKGGYTILHEGALALSEVECQGLRIDKEYLEKQNKLIDKRVDEIEEKLYKTKFYKAWKHRCGGKVNLNSEEQLGHYLYNVKKITPLKHTIGGKGSTDDESLRLLNIPELDLILQRKKLKKLQSTYLNGFSSELVNGFIHPVYNLHIARTYRSSSSDPNFQNIPKRDKESMKIIRSSIYPRKGHQLMELDYSQIEVGIAATYHKDPVMLKYIWDKSTDMHADTSKLIFKINDFDKHQSDHSYLRSAVKNSFVFPQFYGDYWKNCAVNICSNWLHLPLNVKWKSGMGYKMNKNYISDLLIKKGMGSFDSFSEQIQKIENNFWNEKFVVYSNWKKKQYNSYLKKGYVTQLSGFRCQGVMWKNDSINYPVQGAAFHCLLWTMTQVVKELKKLKLKSKVVGQIHDSMLLDIYPPELIQVYNIVQEIATKRILKRFPWINIPLVMEAELSDVDKSWADKVEWKP